MEKVFLEKLVSIRRKIHSYPELGEKEFRTSSLVQKILKDNGVKARKIAGTGVVGLIKGKKPGRRKVIAIRADMDALPIEEKTGKPYASKRAGVMHACGHDANTTMALGAAMLLSKRRNEFSGSVKFIFQPNEESSGGARSLIKAGVMKNPKVDAIVGMHVNPWQKLGTLGLKYKEMMAAVDRFTVEIVGEGGHGAYPHLGRDAVVVSSHVILALQSLVSREVDPLEPVVVTIGVVKGGERFNILCDRVTLEGTVRTLGKTLAASMKAKIEKKVALVARAFGAGYKLKYERLGEALVNSSSVLNLSRRAAEKVLGKPNIVAVDRASMGGEDFAEYLKHAPGCFLYIGTSGKYPWHHEKFDINERALPAGAKVLSEIAVQFLK
ncbi:MAG: amidohydrolase [Endomicrobiales bacterium]|nr:amidohydrolase [Endomicrobiales bacterium]